MRTQWKLANFTMALVLLGATPASAGWLADFCERHLVRADPYQFEDASDWYVQRELDRLEAELIWNGRLSFIDNSTLKVLRREMELRQALREGKLIL